MCNNHPLLIGLDADVAFHKFKQVLTEAPILTYPNPEVPFILDTDTSGTGIGAVLSQRLADQ